MIKLIKRLLANFVLFFVVGCSAYTTTPSSSATNIPLATPFIDSEQLPIASPTALVEPFELTTPIPTSTSFLVLTEEVISLATISPDDVKAFVLELTIDNQNCTLPCFWNIIPGKTEWQNAEAFLSTFAYGISYEAEDGTFSDVPVGDSFIAWMTIFIPELSNAPFSYAFKVRDGIVTMVDAAILPVSTNSLPAILKEYGQPTEIWVLTASAPMDDELGFRLTLFYSQQQFLLMYGGNGEVVNDEVIGCLSDEEDSLHLVVWSPEDELTFPQVVYGLRNPRPTTYDLPLGEASGTSLGAFYETFRDSDEPVCLETPARLWPGP